jgi:hypothetical protein
MAKARIGAKLVKTLPRLDDRRRQAYRGQFTDAQCRAWGARTWAATVLGEAERAIGSAARLIAKAEVPGYPKQRLAWLAELLVELEASIAQDDLPTQKRIRAEARGRAEAVDRLRRQLVAALQRLAPADAAYLRRVSALNVSNPAPQRLVQTLVGLVRLARQQRSTDDARLLADDCGLTEALLE